MCVSPSFLVHMCVLLCMLLKRGAFMAVLPAIVLAWIVFGKQINLYALHAMPSEFSLDSLDPCSDA